MKTRIKYKEVIDKPIIFSQSFFCKDDYLYVIINKKSFNYVIMNSIEVMNSGKANSMVSAKRKAKAALIKLGVIFCDERRKKIII